ncbi:hypothetical protein OBBRIDRAFT_760045 [Obba rivulosa]|uniref:WW domain-containing protein n=1 Tax=Obba rivulosa TaxID=1052685 RepID=A0A8E2DIU8_9APHY|nr:hypothetical protein OBBRIDRAFT_760045 [Obba rivulosa]
MPQPPPPFAPPWHTQFYRDLARVRNPWKGQELLSLWQSSETSRTRAGTEPRILGRDPSRAAHMDLVDRSSKFLSSRRGTTREIKDKSNGSIERSASNVQNGSRGPRNIYPISFVNRYYRNTTIPDSASTYIIEPMSDEFALTEVPPRWRAFTHPDGALYFFNYEKRIYTDAYICEKSTFSEIEAFMECMENLKKSHSVNLEGSEIECVLELEPRDQGGFRWCYYFVNTSKRVLFWLHKFDLSYEPDFKEVRGVTCTAHIKHWMDSKYWTHWEMFPHGRNVPPDAVLDLTAILSHGAIDRITSDEAVITYSAEELINMLDLIKGITNSSGDSSQARDETEGSHEHDTRNTHAVCIVARLMTTFTIHRFRNFYGQHGARLSRDQAIYGPTPRRTALIYVFSPLLFGAPEAHLCSLEKIWVDSVMSYPHWSHFMERLKIEWSDFLLPATVLLSANVGFLAIPSVDENSGRGAAQIFSRISMTASMGSIILSLLLTRQNGHHLRLRETAYKVVRFLKSRKYPALGMEALAITYSLPYGLMLWAIITFSIAFSFECFLKHEPVATAAVAIIWIIIAALVGWCVYVGWERNDSSSLAAKVLRLFGINRSVRFRVTDLSDRDVSTIV